MVLVNAPVPVADPAVRAIDMAVDMQRAVQDLGREWRDRGHQIGFGVGLAMGEATVGRIGYESRSDYTAIGSVVNLASRLCSSAQDGEILAEGVLSASLQGKRSLVRLGARRIKGYNHEVLVFAVPFDRKKQPVSAAS
jgi:class 3 adenylate cyclase